MKVTIIPIVIGAFCTVTKKLLKRLGVWRMRGDHPYYNIIENSQNTKKSPGDSNSSGRASTKADVKNSQGVIILIIMIIIIGDPLGDVQEI